LSGASYILTSNSSAFFFFPALGFTLIPFNYAVPLTKALEKADAAFDDFVSMFDGVKMSVCASV